MKIAGKALYAVAFVAVFVAMAFPLYWLLITSVKPVDEVVADPPVLWPSEFVWTNFQLVLENTETMRAATNSVVVAVCTTVITVVFGTMAAYPLAGSALSAKIRGGLVLWILATRTFPPISSAIPYYLFVSELGLVDTRTGLVLTYVSMYLPFVIWLMMGFFQEVPREVDEAAMIDGCSLVQRLTHVLVPLVRPGVAVSGVLVLIASWNEFLFASILTSTNAKTLPVVLAGFSSNQFQRWGEMAAMGTLMMIPLLVIGILAQRQLIRGLTFGAVKG